MGAVTIDFVTEDAALRRVHPVMVQLRPHLDVDAFVERVKTQFAEGMYRLVALQDAGVVRAAAGYRIQTMLVRGRILYVDDLVTDATVRSRGYGKRLFEWLVDRAREAGCSHVDLDSGVQRHEAHRFYLRDGRMDITGYHFVKRL